MYFNLNKLDLINIMSLMNTSKLTLQDVKGISASVLSLQVI